MRHYDLLIVGAGPAGLSAAASAQRSDVGKIAVIDRLPAVGGMLTQCFHRGFGQAGYGKELTGPEFIGAFMGDGDWDGVDIFTDSFVLEIRDDSSVVAASGADGVYVLHASAIILSTGCRERPIGHLPVYGTRPAGVFTAGSVQKMLNLSGYTVGKRAVVLGSGDVGMIVAHHLTQSGTQVLAVLEKKNAIGGLARNKRRYLDAHDIPVLTGHTLFFEASGLSL